MVFSRTEAHPEVMDAFEMTRPVLSSTKLFTRRPAAPILPALDVAAALIEARRYVHQLPLGLSPGPGGAPSWAAGDVPLQEYPAGSDGPEG